jgi:hypothetical protein
MSLKRISVAEGGGGGGCMEGNAVPDSNKRYVKNRKLSTLCFNSFHILSLLYNYLVTGRRWSSQGTPGSSISKTDRQDITEILLKVSLNTITFEQNMIYKSLQTFYLKVSFHFHNQYKWNYEKIFLP